MDGLHSPFGVIGKIIDARGYSLHHILWEESWVNLMMQFADSPRYVKGKRSITVDNVEDLKKALGR